MNKLLAIALLSVLALPVSITAQTPPVVLTRYQCVAPTFDDKGVCLTANVDGFFGYWSTNLVTLEQQLNPCGQASFDLMADPTKEVTSGGVTVTQAQLAALNAQSCVDHWNTQQAAAKAAKPVARNKKLPPPPVYPRKYLAADGVNVIADHGNGVMSMTLVNVVSPPNRVQIR